MADNGKTVNQLDPGLYNGAWLIGITNPANGDMNYLPLQALAFALANLQPAKPFPDVAAMLANNSILSYFFAFVGDISSETGIPGWGLYLYTGPNTEAGRIDILNYKLISAQGSAGAGGGSWVQRGPWDASGGTFPDDGTTYTNVKAYNTFYVTTAGQLDFGYGLEDVPAGSLLIALEDSPGQNGTKYRLL
jgi:hypothetical protein